MKKVLVITAMLVFFIVAEGCGKAENENSETGSVTIQEPKEEKTGLMDEEFSVDEKGEENANYECDELELYEDIDEIQGKIVDIEVDTTSLYLLSDNKIYTTSFDGLEEVLEVQEKTQEMEIVGFPEITVKNTDGTYTMYLDNDAKDVFEIEKVNELVYACLDIDMDGDYAVLKKEADGYYVDGYNAFQEEREIDTAKLRVKIADEFVEENIKSIGWENTLNYFVLLDDGNVYRVDMGILLYDKEGNTYDEGDELGYASIVTDWTMPIFTNVEKMYGYYGLYSTPIHSEIGNNAALYVCNPEFSYDGEPIEDKLEIPLPDGYTNKDIAEVISTSGEEDIIVIFTDGNIYYAGEDSLETLKPLEELSALNKENKVKKIRFDDWDWSVLMDDGCLYSLEF